MDDSVKMVATVAVCTVGAYFAYRACCRYEPGCSAIGCTQHLVRLHRKGKVRQCTDLEEILLEASALSELQVSLRDNLDSSFGEIEYEVDYDYIVAEAHVKNTNEPPENQSGTTENAEVELRRRSIIQLFSSASQGVANAVLYRTAQIRSSVNGLFNRHKDNQNGVQSTNEPNEQNQGESQNNTGDDSHNQSRLRIFLKSLGSGNKQSLNSNTEDAHHADAVNTDQKPNETFHENSVNRFGNQSTDDSASAIPNLTAVSEEIHKAKSNSTEKAAPHTQSRTDSDSLPSTTQGNKKQEAPAISPTSSEKTTERSLTTLSSSSATQPISATAASSNSRADSKVIEKTTRNNTKENRERPLEQVEANEETLRMSNASYSLEMPDNTNGAANLESVSISTETVTMSSETSVRKITFEEYLLFLSLSPPSSECDHHEELLLSVRDAVSKKQIQIK